MGQMLYATPALLASKGLAADAQDPDRLLAAPPKELLLEVGQLAGGSLDLLVVVLWCSLMLLCCCI